MTYHVFDDQTIPLNLRTDAVTAALSYATAMAQTLSLDTHASKQQRIDAETSEADARMDLEVLIRAALKAKS